VDYYWVSLEVVTHAVTVEAAFEAERGVVITSNIPGEWIRSHPFFLKPGDTVELERPDGSTIIATVRGIDLLSEPIGTPYGSVPESQGIGILLEDITSKVDVPGGSKIYATGNS
jgi:hypothetical protein